MSGFLADHAAVIGLFIVVGLFVLFALERFPPVTVAVGGAALFMVLGFLPLESALGAFANPAPITIGAMFILSAALVRTGVLEALAAVLLGQARKSPRLALLQIYGSAAGASAFLNNTPIVIVLVQVLKRLGQAIGVPATRLLLPLSYIAILGGTLTLIGTSTNLLVDGVAREQGLAPFGIFEMTAVGLVALATGATFLLVLARRLPDRADSPIGEASSQIMLSELEVTGLNKGLGEPLGEVADWKSSQVKLVALKRRGRLIRHDLEHEVVSEGDRLVVHASPTELATFLAGEGWRVGLTGVGDAGEQLIEAGAANENLFELAIAPTHPAIGQELADIPFLSRLNVRILGVVRDGHMPGPDLQTMRIRAGDRLLVLATTAAQRQLRSNRYLLGLAASRPQAFRRSRAPIALAALGGAILAATLGLADIAMAAMIAVAVVLLTRTIDADEAWRAIDGNVLVLIFAMLAIGAGLQQTGSIDLLVGWLLPLVEGRSFLLLLLGTYFLTSLLTEIVTNNAVAVLMPPIVIGLAADMGIDARPLVIAIMFGASASFATPIGYQTNTIVYTAADYRFSDFLKVGVPMNIVVGLATCFAIWAMM